MKPLPLIRLLTLALALAALGPTAAWAEDPSTPITSWSCQVILNGTMPGDTARCEIAAIEGPLNEAVPFTFRVKFPADYKIPAHWHPAIEHVTVLSGTFNFGTGDKLDTDKDQGINPRQLRNHASQDQSLRLD